MYLNTHTYFSLRYGTIKPRDLLNSLQQAGVKRFALTDINSSSACLEVLRLAPRFGTRPTVGIDFRNGAQQLFILLAANNQGLLAINRFVSRFLHKPELERPLEDQRL